MLRAMGLLPLCGCGVISCNKGLETSLDSQTDKGQIWLSSLGFEELGKQIGGDANKKQRLEPLPQLSRVLSPAWGFPL